MESVSGGTLDPSPPLFAAATQLVPLPTVAAPPPSPAECPSPMLLVDGDYCPNLTQTCVRWKDPPTDPFAYIRCAEWKRPATCEGPTVHERYCIDREEFVRSGETLPAVHVSWTEAEATCEERGARLCTEPEWELACEGEEMLPFPYGYVRDSSICNFDRTDLGKMGEGLTDHRAPADAFPACTSPFGVHDMVGNVDEWTARVGKQAPNRSALHGGWWLPGRNNCRQATLAHAEDYSAKQVGFRCCTEATR
jgi:sulfatase modifying factor 1